MTALFIHIPKCGGTSISESIWPDEVRDAQGKNGVHWGIYPQPTIDMIITGWEEDNIPPDNLETYDYIFSVVRNPWSRAVSWYFWHIQRHLHEHFEFYRTFASFEDWIMEGMPTRPYPTRTYFSQLLWLKYGADIHMVCDRVNNRRRYDSGGYDPVIPDQIFKMEDLFDPDKPDWDELISKIGLGAYKPLRQMNSSKHKPYKEHYTIASAQKVCDICQQDIEFFGYTF